MKKQQFEQLKVGDICVVKKGHDEGRKCRVLLIDGSSIVIKSLDGEYFRACDVRRNLRITDWRQVDIA